MGGTTGDAPALVVLWEECAGPSRSLIARAADFTLPEAVAATENAALKRGLARDQEELEHKRPCVRSSVDSRWPVSLRGNLKFEGDPRARAHAESAARSKALVALRSLVTDAELPNCESAGWFFGF